MSERSRITKKSDAFLVEKSFWEICLLPLLLETAELASLYFIRRGRELR